ncbi:MAG: isoprenyl transferase [Gammaproteobacteria bacterium]
MDGEGPQKESAHGAVLPRHIAIIMDGNGRWARKRGLPRTAGHRSGVKALRRTVETCARRGIEVLTVFAFSSENWRRPRQEVGTLMRLMIEALDREVGELAKQGVQLRFIGDRNQLDEPIRERMAAAEKTTASNNGLILVVALAYGGRLDIVKAARKLASDAAAGQINPQDIDEELFAGCLGLAGLPDPDLLIRTGGEWRISNFLIWNLAYSECFFDDCLWPDFDEGELDSALSFFAGRERRFGQVLDNKGATA